MPSDVPGSCPPLWILRGIPAPDSSDALPRGQPDTFGVSNRASADVVATLSNSAKPHPALDGGYHSVPRLIGTDLRGVPHVPGTIE
jgi:hypothetical protein